LFIAPARNLKKPEAWKKLQARQTGSRFSERLPGLIRQIGRKLEASKVMPQGIRSSSFSASAA
jgi:hypothetical protein